MKKLLIFFKDYKKETMLGPLFKLLEALFDLLVPLVVAKIVDNGIAQANKSYIIYMCLILVVLGIVGLLSSIIAQYFAAKAAVGFATKLRHSLFDKMQNISFSEIDSLGTSSMITRMTSDVNQVQTGVNLVLRLFLRSPVIVFGAMIMAFTIDVKAALIFTVAIPLLSIVVFGIMLITIPLYKKVQKRLDGVLGLTRENLSGSRVIRAFCKEESEINELKQQNNVLTSTQILVGRISALMNPVTYVIINIAIILLIWTGAVRVNMGIITQGAVLALYNYMSQILIELIKLANLIITVTKSLASANRISAVLEMKSSLEILPYNDANRNLSTDHIVFKNVSLTYKDAGEQALTDIDFSVRRGETVGIIGGTGSGKTSLINLISHFYDATKGQVLVNGIDVKAYPINDLRSKIGIVMQKAVLFKGTIRENLLVGKENATDEELYFALEVAQATDIIKNKEGGLDSEIEQSGRNLSGGQRQRLTIARAIVRNPEILIFDDSASALDYATDAKLRKAIRNLNSNPTVFIVSQRTSSLQHADKIVVLEDGEIVGIGKHKELLDTCEVYREIYYSQVPREDEK